MGSGKCLMEMGMSAIMLVGIVLLAMAIMPSSAQEVSSPTSLPNPVGFPPCIMRIGECMLTKAISEDGLTSDPTKCCSVIKAEVANATCFCSLEEVHKNMTSIAPSPTTFDMPKVPFSQVELEYNKLFAKCNIDTTFDKLCNDVETLATTSGSTNGAKSGNTNGANKIALAGLLPSTLLIWALVMFL